jgi:hypothetical protein
MLSQGCILLARDPRVNPPDRATPSYAIERWGMLAHTSGPELADSPGRTLYSPRWCGGPMAGIGQ